MSIQLTATFTPDEVLDIIKRHLSQEGFDVSEIKTIASPLQNENGEGRFLGVEAKETKQKPVYSQYDR